MGGMRGSLVNTPGPGVMKNRFAKIRFDKTSASKVVKSAMI